MSDEKASQDERIREAAHQLARAMTDSGAMYEAWLHSVDVRSVEDQYPRYAYEVHVTERHERQVAP